MSEGWPALARGADTMGAQMADDSDRLSREVADALRQAHAEELERLPRRRRGWTLADPRPSSPSQVMIAGGVLLVARLFGVYTLLGLGALAPTLAQIGLIILIIGFVTWLIRPPRREMYWRGRRIELEPSPSLSHRLYRLLYRDA